MYTSLRDRCFYIQYFFNIWQESLWTDFNPSHMPLGCISALVFFFFFIISDSYSICPHCIKRLTLNEVTDVKAGVLTIICQKRWRSYHCPSYDLSKFQPLNGIWETVLRPMWFALHLDLACLSAFNFAVHCISWPSWELARVRTQPCQVKIDV